MSQDSKAFYTLNQTFTSLPVKQKIYLFSSPSNLYRTYRNFQHPESTQQTHIRKQDLRDYDWQPRLPSKKLLEQPRFFESLQRKKYRFINAIQDLARLKCQSEAGKILQGKKIKSRRKKVKQSSNDKNLPTLVHESFPLKKYAQQERVGWQSHGRTPFLNFNMQYLIKKRKKVTSLSPQKGSSKMFNYQGSNK